MTPFAARVLGVLRRIPPGRVATYGDVARIAGRPGAARAVGGILRRAGSPGLPYHRVIAAGGRLGGYSSLALKASLLAAEGLIVRRGRVQDFSQHRWPGRETSHGHHGKHGKHGKQGKLGKFGKHPAYSLHVFRAFLAFRVPRQRAARAPRLSS
jgi:methylated-DNA-protein-cysteine methyltransferase-like protein